MKAFSSPLPRNRLRTIASPHSTPKTVLSGTAMAAAIRVTWKAWTVLGSDSACQTGSSPCWNVR
jgi:hypothetical protein